MSEIMTPGAPTVLPAGYAAQSLAGGFPSIVLTANAGSSDILELTGVLTAQDCTAVIPIPAFPTQVLGSNAGGSYSGPTTNGWMKIIKNSTTGPFNVFVHIQGPGNSLLIPQGAMWVYSPDGVNVFSACCSDVEGDAFADGIIYQPLGTFNGTNVFPVWGGPFPSVMAAIALTNGNVNVEIDDTFQSPAPIPVAGMPVGGWDMQGRVTFTNARQNAGINALVTIPDGATLKNLAGLSGVRIQSHAQLAGSNLPSLSFTLPVAFSMNLAAVIDTHFAAPAATRPAVDIAAGVTLTPILQNSSTLETGAVGAEVFNLLSAGSILSMLLVSSSVIFPAKNVVAGAGSLFVTRDRTTTPFITSLPSYTGPAAVFALREGTDSLNQVIVPAGATYVIDAAAINGPGPNGFDEMIFCSPAPGPLLVVQLPDPRLPMNKGRVIKVTDNNGTSLTNPIALTPFVGTLLNGVALPAQLNSNWGEWQVESDGTQWIVGGSGFGGAVGGARQYGYFSARAVGAQAPIAVGANVLWDFPDGPFNTAGFTHVAGSDTVTITVAGDYKVQWNVCGTQSNQFTLHQNAAPVVGACFGAGAGTEQNVGFVIIRAAIGDALTLKNFSSAAAVGLALQGGTNVAQVGAALLVEKVS
jgi:hypothetical protein